MSVIVGALGIIKKKGELNTLRIYLAVSANRKK